MEPVTVGKEKTSVIDSLNSENNILHRELDTLKQQFADAQSAKSRLEEQVEMLKQQIAPAKAIEVKILSETQTAHIEKLLIQGWVNLHMQFEDGKLRTVWQRENKPDSPKDETKVEASDAPTEEIYPLSNIQVIADTGFKSAIDITVPREVAVGRPIQITIPSTIPQPENLNLGPVGKSLLENGFDDTIAAMDDMLNLTLKATDIQDKEEILSQFQAVLPAGESS